MSSEDVLEQLAFARRIADYAGRLGVERISFSSRVVPDHIGAILADAVLQAGVSYRTVVRMRVERIRLQFPEAARLSGLVALIERDGAVDILLWKHATKLNRFVSLAQFLATQDIETTVDLNCWLCRGGARDSLLRLHGIGPKTFDYLCGLVGIDCIAVDRHVRAFVNEAGVPISDYDHLKSIVSYAADLLGMARRDFDAWIWRTISTRQESEPHLSLI